MYCFFFGHYALCCIADNEDSKYQKMHYIEGIQKSFRFKGIVHKMNIFEGFNKNRYFLYKRGCFLQFFCLLVDEKIRLKVFAFSFEITY